LHEAARLGQPPGQGGGLRALEGEVVFAHHAEWFYSMH
jgi:hypothetical protein